MNLTLTSVLDSVIQSMSKLYDRLESFANKDGQKKGIWGVAVLVSFSVILFLNILTPMIADDFGYLHIFGELGYVNSFADLIHSQQNHYVMWGGRSVVHFIAQALLQMPSLLVDILNSAVYLLFIFLIYKHIVGREKKNSLSLFVLINLTVWFVIPMFGDTILWVTGSANYLWGTTIILLFLLPYRLYEGKAQKGLPLIFCSILMFVFGIIAGWTNENTVAGMIVIILLFMLYYRSQKWQLPVAYLVGLLGVIIGYAIMIAAPGNYTRGGEAAQLSLFIVLFRFFTHTQNLFLNYGWLIAIYAVLLILYRRFTSKLTDGSTFSLSFVFVLGALASIYAMVFSPQFPSRAWFGLVVYLIIAVGIVFYRLNYEEKFLRQIRFSLLFVALVAFLFSFYLATKDVHRIYEMDKAREVLAKEARGEGAEKCYFDVYNPQTSYVHGEEAHEGNLLLSRYYGVFIEYNK